MFRNYLLTAYRSLQRNKTFSIINILGLAVGMAACLLIFLFVQDERSYDRHFSGAERIHRIGFERVYPTHTTFWAPIPPAVIPAVREELPGVEACTHFVLREEAVREGERFFEKTTILMVDSSLLDVFDVHVLTGDAQAALRDPSSILVSESFARKVFGEADPLGQVLTFRDTLPYTIGAVLSDLPAQTHFDFQVLASLPPNRDLSEWGSAFFFYSYVKLRPDYTQKAFGEDLTQLARTHLAKTFDNEQEYEAWVEAGNEYRFFPQPLTDIHLHSDFKWEVQPNGDITYVYLFGAIAIFILLIAVINFTNLSTARSLQRVREVGIRKVMGSRPHQIALQQLLESALMSFLALLLAVPLLLLALPEFNVLIGKSLSVSYFYSFLPLLTLLACAIGLGVLAGLYPALYLSGFRPVILLQGRLATWKARQKKRAGWARNGMVVLQFALSLMLIAGTLAVYRQLTFLQNQKLGFDREQILLLENMRGVNTSLTAMKEELLRIPGVEQASIAIQAPDNMNEASSFAPKSSSSNELVNMVLMAADHTWLETYGVSLAAGRNFYPEEILNQPPQDQSEEMVPVLLNQPAVQALGLGDSVLDRVITEFTGQNFKVIGVMEDFHFESLRHTVKPLIYMPSNFGEVLSLRIRPGALPGVIGEVEKVWDDFSGGRTFTYSFLDKRITQLYRSEQVMGTLSLIFSGLAIFLACLGLFGLAAFSLVQRTKEIGIRKVCGATVGNILTLLAKEYVRLILIAAVIALPLAAYGIVRWLEGYAFHAGLSPWVFLLPVLLLLAIAALAVGGITLRAARTNPVEALRSE